MSETRANLTRKNLPKGRDGEYLVIDSRAPRGLRWRPSASSAPAPEDATTKGYVDTQHAGYVCASATWVAVSWGLSLGAGANYQPVLTPWTLHAPNSDWTETSGEFEYTGTYPASGSRRFLVQWSWTLWFYTFQPNVAICGKIAKEPSEGSYADVPGSMEISGIANYGTFLTAYLFFHNLSGSCIVSMEAGDKIKFQHGTFGFGTYGVVAYASIAGTDGATITITPIG